MTTNLTDEQVASEMADIEDTSAWPNWPILPVKKYAGVDGRHEMLVGIVTASHKSRIYLCNMWELKTNVSIGEQVATMETVEFESVEAMVRDGWMAD